MSRLTLRDVAPGGEVAEALKAWKTAKVGCIGGSSAAPAIGLGRYGSRRRLWAEMTGQLAPDDRESEAMYWGSRLEPYVVAAVTRRTEYTWVHRPRKEVDDALDAECVGTFGFVTPPQPLYRNRERDWQVYSPDGFVRNEAGEYGLFEAKTTNAFLSRDWGDEPPEFVVIQAHHGMAVLGLPYTVVAVLVGGQDLRVYRVDRDEELIDAITNAEEDFMHHVIEGTPPPLENPVHPDTLDVLGELHGADDGSFVELRDGVDAWCREYLDAQRAVKEASERKSTAKAHLADALGDAAGGSTAEDMEGGRFQVTYKTVKRDGYTVKPTSYRTMRVREVKPE